MAITAFLFALALGSTAAQVEIARIDRPAYRAELLEIDGGGLRAAQGNEITQIPLEKLRAVRFPDTDPSVTAAKPQQVVLSDGSTAECVEFTSQGETASMSILRGESVSVPATAVRQVRLQPLNEQQLGQWQAICRSRASGDVLVLIRSEEALEKLEGIVRGVTPQAVNFDFNGQLIAAPLAKLAGIRFFSGGDPGKDPPKLAAVVTDVDGNRWQATRVTRPADAESVQLMLQCGASVSLPMASLREIDFSAGSLRYVAELEPLNSQVTQRLPLLETIRDSHRLFTPRRRSPSRTDSSTAGIDMSGPGLEFFGSGSTVYRIPEGFTRLVGSVELRPTGNRYSPCLVSIRLESREIWQSRLEETGLPQPIDVPIQPDQRLTLQVKADSENSVGDLVLWHSLRLLK